MKLKLPSNKAELRNVLVNIKINALDYI